MSVVQMNDWAVVYVNDDPFQPPESGIALKGTVIGHPRKPDGKQVRTSAIAEMNGRLITTESGTVYRLGSPHPEYREWLKVHRPNWDPENPVTLIP